MPPEAVHSRFSWNIADSARRLARCAVHIPTFNDPRITGSTTAPRRGIPPAASARDPCGASAPARDRRDPTFLDDRRKSLALSIVQLRPVARRLSGPRRYASRRHKSRPMTAGAYLVPHRSWLSPTASSSVRQNRREAESVSTWRRSVRHHWLGFLAIWGSPMSPCLPPLMSCEMAQHEFDPAIGSEPAANRQNHAVASKSRKPSG